MLLGQCHSGLYLYIVLAVFGHRGLRRLLITANISSYLRMDSYGCWIGGTISVLPLIQGRHNFLF